MYIRSEGASLFKMIPERQDNWKKFKNHDFEDEETVTQLVAPSLELAYEACSIYGCNAFVMFGSTAYLKRVDPDQKPEPRVGMDTYMLEDAEIFKIKESWRKFEDLDYEGKEVKNMIADNLENVYAECAKMGCNAFSLIGDTAWLKQVVPGQATIRKEGCKLHVRKDLAMKQPANEGEWDVLKNHDFENENNVTTVVINASGDLQEVYEACSLYDCNAFVVFGATAYLKRVSPTQKPNASTGMDVHIRRDAPAVNAKTISLAGQKLSTVFGDP